MYVVDIICELVWTACRYSGCALASSDEAPFTDTEGRTHLPNIMVSETGIQRNYSKNLPYLI